MIPVPQERSRQDGGAAPGESAAPVWSQRLLLVSSLVLALALLTIYLGFLWQAWGPKLARQPLLAPRVSEPLAGDFPLFYAASYLALAGEPAAVYQHPRLGAVEKTLTGTGPHPWPYPPMGLLVVLPLALLPYLAALGGWLAVTLSAYLLVLRRTSQNLCILLWGLAFFGTFENFYFGQNGFLSAALMGGGLLLLDRRPFLGGAVLGLLCYKPQMLLLVPLALLAGRRWRSLGGVLASAGCLALASLLVFGRDTWSSFGSHIPQTLNTLAMVSTWFYKMPTIFASARLAGYSPKVAWLFHGLGMLTVSAAIVWLWSRPTSRALRAAVLVLGVLMFTPHLWYYDLPLLAVALAWLYREGQAQGWLPGELWMLLAAWLLPLVSFALAVDYHWPLGPAYLAGAWLLVIRRYLQEKRVPRGQRAS